MVTLKRHNNSKGEPTDPKDLSYEPPYNKTLPPAIIINTDTGERTVVQQSEPTPDVINKSNKRPAVSRSTKVKKIVKGKKPNTIPHTASRPAEGAQPTSFRAAPDPLPEEQEEYEEEYVEPVITPKVPVRIAGAFGEMRCNVAKVIDGPKVLTLVVDLEDESYYVPPESPTTTLKIKALEREYSVRHVGITVEDEGFMYIILIKVV